MYNIQIYDSYNLVRVCMMKRIPEAVMYMLLKKKFSEKN